MRLPAWLDHSGQRPTRTMSQDAKFFQRGKIQVRVLPMRVFFLCAAKTHAATVQEFRQELQAAETKDKKFTKRKTVLKKIVANITMGNDSPYCQRLLARSCSWICFYSVGSVRRRCAMSGNALVRDQEKCVRAFYRRLNLDYLRSGLPLSHQLWAVEGRIYPHGYPEFPSGRYCNSLLQLYAQNYVCRTATTAIPLSAH